MTLTFQMKKNDKLANGLEIVSLGISIKGQHFYDRKYIYVTITYQYTYFVLCTEMNDIPEFPW